MTFKKIDPEVKQFIQTQYLMYLSTLDNIDPFPLVTCMFYLPDEDCSHLYFLSHADSHKMHNIADNPKVGICIAKEQTLETVQITGIAEIETDVEKKIAIFNKLNTLANEKSGVNFPPFLKLEGGTIQIVRVELQTYQYSDFARVVALFKSNETA